MTDINLPDLNASDEIVAENIRAAGAIYFAAMLEEMKIFQVADQLVALFQNGLLPVKKNSARGLYQYWRETPQRLTASDRENLYARVLGTPGGDQRVVPNRDFNELWVRFVASVSELDRQSPTDLEARAAAEEEVRAAGRELAKNLSRHGYGVTFFAATELQKQVDQIVKLLSDPEIQKAYGARDMWQIIDQVATLELGGSANSARYRSLASSGATIIAWLAKNARKFSLSSQKPMIDVRRSRAPDLLSGRSGGIKSPSDAHLLKACENWLAVSGTSDGSIEDSSQPFDR